jgi:hypothetical protein
MGPYPVSVLGYYAQFYFILKYNLDCFIFSLLGVGGFGGEAEY